MGDTSSFDLKPADRPNNSRLRLRFTWSFGLSPAVPQKGTKTPFSPGTATSIIADVFSLCQLLFLFSPQSFYIFQKNPTSCGRRPIFPIGTARFSTPQPPPVSGGTIFHTYKIKNTREILAAKALFWYNNGGRNLLFPAPPPHLRAAGPFHRLTGPLPGSGAGAFLLFYTSRGRTPRVPVFPPLHSRRFSFP